MNAPNEPVNSQIAIPLPPPPPHHVAKETDSKDIQVFASDSNVRLETTDDWKLDTKKQCAKMNQDLGVKMCPDGELEILHLKNDQARGSIDSSISLSYDAKPFTPRGSVSAGEGTTSSSTEDEYKAAEMPPRSSSDGNDTAAGFQTPDAELTKKIVAQVEYYFSDENILKDAFLLKHVRRNKEGYVSLKLISSFKRVKHIARDWKVVRAALVAGSVKLEVNKEGTKLRRKEPLPQYDQTTPSRTVIVLNMSEEKASIEVVAEIFRGCGEIALVRIIRPGNPVPSDVRSFYNKHPEMETGVSALIEFVRTESAHTALAMDGTKCSALGAVLRVVELNSAGVMKKPRGALGRKGALLLDSEWSSSCQSGSEAEDLHKLRLHQRRGSELLSEHQWAHQRRWSRDSGTESSSSGYTRSRSNSGILFHLPDQRRPSTGWDSSSDSYSSCGRSRSNSGVSVPDVFHMRRYSLPRKEGSCCCCEHAPSVRRYSVGRWSDDGCSASLQRSPSGENFHEESYNRRDSITEYLAFERRPSLSRANNDGQWSRSSSISSAATDSPRRLSDADGRLPVTRNRSFGNGVSGLSAAAAENVVRLPRGPDGGRGFQRDIVQYSLEE